jgi:hypothetical protein
MASRLFWSAGVAVCAAALIGCDGSGSETVSGKLTLDGAPLAEAHIGLVPKDATVKGGPFVGDTDDQGQFTLGPPGDPTGGVPAGAYSLSITTAYSGSGSETAVTPPERIPAPYTTGVDFEVPAGGTTAANFDLSSKR